MACGPRRPQVVLPSHISTFSIILEAMKELAPAHPELDEKEKANLATMKAELMSPPAALAWLEAEIVSPRTTSAERHSWVLFLRGFLCAAG